MEFSKIRQIFSKNKIGFQTIRRDGFLYVRFFKSSWPRTKFVLFQQLGMKIFPPSNLPRWCSDKAAASWPQGRGFESRLEPIWFQISQFRTKLAPSGIRTHDLVATKPLLCHCTTEACLRAKKFSDQVIPGKRFPQNFSGKSGFIQFPPGPDKSG